MPFANYKDFKSCVAANKDKDDPNAYCGRIYWETEGKHRRLKPKKKKKHE